jgi:uncharacterized protein CbrC (UPF0167 family)
MTLPNFKYHPDPINTGTITTSDETCGCCGQARGFIYGPAVYSKHDVPSVCPWCIDEGKIAEKYDAELSDSHPLYAAGVPDEVVIEVSQRTPGYYSIQQEEWLCHCNDACEFHGEARISDLKALTNDGLNLLFDNSYLDENEWKYVLENYVTGDGEFLKFVCRTCGEIRIGIDMD